MRVDIRQSQGKPQIVLSASDSNERTLLSMLMYYLENGYNLRVESSVYTEGETRSVIIGIRERADKVNDTVQPSVPS